MADSPSVPAKAKRCILLWMQGGPSHIDTFDPKPDAPAEIRGEFGTIPTTLPGVRFAEQLPLLAKQTDKLAVIRGHDPKNGSHGIADHLMMTGHKFNPSLPFPCFGSVVAKERGYDDGMLPFVQLGRASTAASTAASRASSATSTTPSRSPTTPAARASRSATSPSPATPSESGSTAATPCSPTWRTTRRNVETAGVVKARDEFYEKAHGIITGPAAKQAFDLDAGIRQDPRPLRPQLARPGVPARPAADRGRRAVRHRHRRRLGHAHRTTSGA